MESQVRYATLQKLEEEHTTTTTSDTSKVIKHKLRKNATEEEFEEWLEKLPIESL